MDHCPFEHIRIEGYRRLANVNLALKPLNVVIGGNGSGKTSLLEVMSLLSASASGELADAFSALGGYSSVRTNLTAWTSQAIAFALRQPTGTAEPLEYEVYVQPKGVDYSIGEECLFQDRGQAEPFVHLTASRGSIQYWFSSGTKAGSPDVGHESL